MRNLGKKSQSKLEITHIRVKHYNFIHTSILFATLLFPLPPWPTSPLSPSPSSHPSIPRCIHIIILLLIHIILILVYGTSGTQLEFLALSYYSGTSGVHSSLTLLLGELWILDSGGATWYTSWCTICVMHPRQIRRQIFE